MSVRVMADVWEFGPEDAADCSVLLILADHGNDDGTNCFPSIERIAKRARRSERTVERSIAALEKGGWIAVKKGVGRGNFSSYRVNVEFLKRRQVDAFNEKERVTNATIKGDILTVKGDKRDIPYRRTTSNRELPFRARRGGENKPSNPGAEKQRRLPEQEEFLRWDSCSPEYKLANPWHGS